MVISNGEIQMPGRLRNCCNLCGSININRVRSLRAYRCYACNHLYSAPSTRFVETYEPIPKFLMISKEKKN